MNDIKGVILALNVFNETLQFYFCDKLLVILTEYLVKASGIYQGSTNLPYSDSSYSLGALIRG